MMDYLAFRRMVTPVIIQMIFWLGVLASVVACIAMLDRQPLQAVLVLIGGPLVVRIYCELMIVLFQIHKELVAIRGAGDAKARSIAPPPGMPVADARL